MSTQDLLAADTSMGPVTLLVADLDGMTAYYRDAVALSVIGQTADTVTLGRGTTPIIILSHAPELVHASPRDAGLFHTAILFDSEAALAASVYSVASKATGSFTGSSDHLVSKAFYFTDPEGNGVELYTDRPREQWVWDRGAVRMDTLRLDPNAYLRSHLVPDEADAGVTGAGRVGHVHLQVGDVAAAKAFYVDAIGFEATLTGFPGALFASAGGYHHHIAMNVWNSAGAGPRAASLGLGEVAVTVPVREDLDAVAARLRAAGIPFADDGRSVTARDPWDTQVTLALPGATAAELLAG
jgi:catechol 2,3-dioxygenase